MSIPGRDSTSQPSSSKIRKCVSCLKEVLTPDRPIYHLPCLHSLCFRCRDAQRSNLEKSLHCTVCNQQFSADVVYDEFIPDPKRTKCMSSNCTNLDLQKISHYCVTCKIYMCAWCIKSHNREHLIRESKPYVPLISRCVNLLHQDRMANFVCSCGARICTDCLEGHRSNCRKGNAIGTFAELNTKAINCLRPLIENDKKSLEYYHNLLQNLQIKRRMVMTEFHNSRTQLAFDCQRMVSLMIQRFQDLADSLEMSQNQYMSHFKKVEADIAEETNRVATINNLEKKITTLKAQDVIPFASFIKHASTNAERRSKYSRINIDNILPLPSVRIDLSHSPQSSNLVQFLSGYGSIVVNNIRQTVRSSFDKPLTFVLPPKLNPAEMGHQSEMGLRLFNGREYEKVDKEKFRRLIKPLADDELRERCVQLESELDYYRRLTRSLEQSSRITSETIRPIPIEAIEGNQPSFPPLHTNNMAVPGPSTSRQAPMPLDGRLRQAYPNFRPAMQPPMRPNGLQMRSPQFINSPQGFMFPPSPNQPNLLRNSHSELQQLMFANSPASNTPSADIVTITLEDERPRNTQSNEVISGTQNGNTSDKVKSSCLMKKEGINEKLENSQESERSNLRRSKSVVNSGNDLTDQTQTSNSAPNSNVRIGENSPIHRLREKSHDSHMSDKSGTSAGRYRAVPDTSGGLKIRIRREEVEPTPVIEPFIDDEGETSRKAAVPDAPQDEWDDYCYSCNEGCDDISGELGCCSTCPRVFHQFCHIPRCSAPMAQLPDDWRCSMCQPMLPITERQDRMTPNIKLACSKVMLACLDDSQQSDPFRKPVDKKFQEYYSVISRPMDLTTVNSKLSGGEYANTTGFIADMNQIFINCSTFNSPDNPLAKCGINVYKKYVEAVKKYLPAYVSSVWMYVCLYKNDEPAMKKRRRN
ncbi:unnamed protein product [Bursaphelenchus xylophilus]|uniref:(pine wood nematode) hypothetical protein n=1 Tax=Bursaphelenchus xylophilus TaxID=6326 RepID=A0A1I7ST91_BURXY|nr:unnamed protein product [Bursaphelenchus xylophilus]CAG9108637.1 unnamed protein product [Bursaphelenchus xylophilus]